MSRDVTIYIVDIFIATNKIGRYIKRFKTAQELLHSELEWDATLRELQVIGEATNHILKNGLIDETYRRIVDFRNQITHGYFGIDEEIVWEVATKKLDAYILELEQVVTAQNLDLSEAVMSAKEEYGYNKEVLLLLSHLEDDKTRKKQ